MPGKKQFEDYYEGTLDSSAVSKSSAQDSRASIGPVVSAASTDAPAHTSRDQQLNQELVEALGIYESAYKRVSVCNEFIMKIRNERPRVSAVLPLTLMTAIANGGHPYFGFQAADPAPEMEFGMRLDRGESPHDNVFMTLQDQCAEIAKFLISNSENIRLSKEEGAIPFPPKTISFPAKSSISQRLQTYYINQYALLISEFYPLQTQQASLTCDCSCGQWTPYPGRAPGREFPKEKVPKEIIEGICNDLEVKERFKDQRREDFINALKERVQKNGLDMSSLMLTAGIPEQTRMVNGLVQARSACTPEERAALQARSIITRTPDRRELQARSTIRTTPEERRALQARSTTCMPDP